MPTSSINIGINQQGKELVERIDLHFKNHEPDFYKNYILSALIELEEDANQRLSVFENGEFSASNRSIKDWFDLELYGEIKRLANIVNETVSNSVIVNIVISICESNSTSQLKLLLEAIKELVEAQQISGVNVKVFVVLFDLDGNTSSNVNLPNGLEAIESLEKEYNSIIADIYYLDDRNVGRVILNFDLNWLAFALGEFFVFEMIKETSGAAMNKSKVFGLGVIHFNELLFRNVVANTILQYKFEQEGIMEDGGVQLRDIINKCNPFIEEQQNFFFKFLDKFPYSNESSKDLTKNSDLYIREFTDRLESFVTSNDHKIGESKAILANLLGEDDEILDGINWTGSRLDLKDVEFDIIDYFNKYLQEEDQVKFSEQKELRNKITELSQSIKKDEKKIRKLEEQATEIRRNLDISFDDGVFSLDGKRINASGYIPSPISPNDELYSINDDAIPEAVDLSAYFSTAKDQGNLGSCTAFPIAAIYEFFAKQNNKIVDISELFVYYNTRDLKGNAGTEIGATLLDAIQAVKEKGACYSKSYPYQIDSFSNKPTDEAFTEAQHQVVKKASRIAIQENDFKHAVASGHPVIIGLKIFESFYPKNKSAIVPFPSDNEKGYENHGNHALLIIGYNDKEKLFKLRNSWGEKFGDKGYCYAPYDYIANQEFCNEAFVITDIVDLSFSKFNYDNSTNLTFINDRTIRQLTIKEFNLRAKKRELTQKKEDHDELALLNEQNTERIKGSTFRKDLYGRLKEEADRTITPTPTPPQYEPDNRKTPYILICVGLLIALGAVFLSSIIPILIVSVVVIIGILIIVFGVVKLLKDNQSPKNEPAAITESSRFGEKDKYAFEVAESLFDIFDEMNQDLIKRYEAISQYYSQVKKWQEESESDLNQIEYESPVFVINVIKKDPLLNYLEKEKTKFLKNLPNLSNTFHKIYNPKTDNAIEAFNELKGSYLNNISENIENILDISIIAYMLGEKEYPYFDPAPPLDRTIENIQKISTPFCNIQQTVSSLQIQDYVIHEEIMSNKDAKLKELAKHRSASIKPILIFRKDNKKKYVAIQVASLGSVNDLVRQ